MVDAIEAWFILNWFDYASAMKVHRKLQAKQPARSMLPLIWILLIAAVGILSYLSKPNRAGRRLPPAGQYQDLVVVLGTAGVVVAAFVVLNVFARRAHRKQFAKLTDDHLNQRWIVDDGGIVLRTPKVESTYLWDYFPKVVESPDAFLLYVTDQSYHTLPTRGFPSPEMMTRFAAVASERATSYVVFSPCQYQAKAGPTGLEDF